MIPIRERRESQSFNGEHLVWTKDIGVDPQIVKSNPMVRGILDAVNNDENIRIEPSGFSRDGFNVGDCSRHI
jgi:hypothetical protein